MTIVGTLEQNIDSIAIVARADHVPGPAQGRWTYAAYAAIPNDGNRYEVIEGVLYRPLAPNLAHQSSNGRFFHYLFPYIELAGLGKVFSAPTDVELSPNNIVQPDITVVLKEHYDRLIATWVVGAPDLIVEIASPGPAGYDRRGKQDVYAGAGVPEYWIADPMARTIEVLLMSQGLYQSSGVYQGQATLPS